jgi:hypothetical protein
VSRRPGNLALACGHMGHPSALTWSGALGPRSVLAVVNRFNSYGCPTITVGVAAFLPPTTRACSKTVDALPKPGHRLPQRKKMVGLVRDMGCAQSHSRSSAVPTRCPGELRATLARSLARPLVRSYVGIGGRSAKKAVTASSRSARLRSGERSRDVSNAKLLPGSRLASSSA